MQDFSNVSLINRFKISRFPSRVIPNGQYNHMPHVTKYNEQWLLQRKKNVLSDFLSTKDIDPPKKEQRLLHFPNVLKIILGSLNSFFPVSSFRQSHLPVLRVHQFFHLANLYIFLPALNYFRVSIFVHFVQSIKQLPSPILLTNFDNRNKDLSLAVLN